MQRQADNLVELVRLLIDSEQEKLKRKQRLKTEPKGYSMAGYGHGCSLCGDYEHKKYVTDSTLAYKSGLHIQTIRKLIRRGNIKARHVPKSPFLILRKDNPNLLNAIEDEAAMQTNKAE